MTFDLHIENTTKRVVAMLKGKKVQNEMDYRVYKSSSFVGQSFLDLRDFLKPVKSERSINIYEPLKCKDKNKHKHLCVAVIGFQETTRY